MDPNESVGRRSEQLLDRTWATIKAARRRDRPAYFFALAGAGIAARHFEARWFEHELGIAQTVAEYYLIVAMMRNMDLLPAKRERGFWAFFGLGILSGLGTIAGLVLLIVPGIILLARWMPAYGFLLGQNRGVTDALGESWDQTRPHFWAILLAMLLPTLAYGAGVAVYVLPELGVELPAFVIALLANVLLYGAALFMTALGIATYAVLANHTSEFSEVFA